MLTLPPLAVRRKVEPSCQGQGVALMFSGVDGVALSMPPAVDGHALATRFGLVEAAGRVSRMPPALTVTVPAASPMVPPLRARVP